MKRSSGRGFVGQFCGIRVGWKDAGNMAGGLQLQLTRTEQMIDFSILRRHVAAAAMACSRAARVVFAPRMIAAMTLVVAWFSVNVSQATIVRFQTSVGAIDVRLYNTITPNSVTNFMNYVTANRYDGTFIHRVPQFKNQDNNNLGTQHFVVQGGGFLLNNSIFAASGIVTNAPIGDEFGISNTRGTLAFAKNALGATSQWFFNVGDNSFLDASDFTVFGRVLGSGMTVVDTIDNLPAINAAVAQNADGEDFDEVPIRNPLTQNDITSNEAVMVNVIALNYPAGDYNRDGTVNAADYSVWKADFGSTTKAEADGNGDGVVNAADYTVWRNTFGQSSVPGAGLGGGLGGLAGGAVPEPASALLCGVAATTCWVCLHRSRGNRLRQRLTA
jgi:cyclophilin family peptidyl-prolyl cis-trans isomerase